MKKNWLGLLSAGILIFFISSCQKDQLADLSALSFTCSHADGVLPVTVSFVATAPNSANVTWDFGDGQTGSGMSTTHTYAAQGLYPVRISAASPGEVTLNRMDTILVFPYTEADITRMDVTIPNPAYVHYKLFTAGKMIFEGASPSPSATATSLSNTFSPPLVITDLQHVVNVQFWNYYNPISTISFKPSSYFQNTLPFPSVFSGQDVQGRTFKMQVSWK